VRTPPFCLFSIAGLVGFGAVIAALPAFGMIREAVLSIGAGITILSIRKLSHREAYFDPSESDLLSTHLTGKR